MLILFQICSYNLVELYNGIQYNNSYCASLQDSEYEGPICSDFLVQIASLDVNVTDQEIILRVGSFVIQLALLFFIRNRLGRNLSYYKEKNVTISDYSLLIKDFPKVPNAQKKIKKVFEEFFYTPIKIEEIIMIGDLELYYKLKYEK